MSRYALPTLTVIAAALFAATANAQGGAADAQQRYEQEIARCNAGNLAAPAREACVRGAGLALDRARGGPPAETAVPSPDGRATVVTPAGSSPPLGASDTTTSGDGRATIVLPADGTKPR